MEEPSHCDLSLSIGGHTHEAEQHYSAPIAPPMPSTVNNERRRCSPEQVEASTDSKKPIENQESGGSSCSTLTIEEVASGSPIQSRHDAHASTERLHVGDDHQVSSTNHQEDEISLELTLGRHCDSRTAKKQKKMSVVYPEGDTEEDRRRGVSTTLKLCLEHPWKIRKQLKDSDLGNLSRLMLQNKTAKENVLGYMSEQLIEEVKSNVGARVTVMDIETRSAHEMVFKLWPSSQSYVLIGKWTKEFVKRRNLKVGDVIGLCWNPYSSVFHFCVLQRVPQTNTPSASS